MGIRMKINKKGFTLIELIVVLVVLAILAAIIVPTTFGASTNAKLAADNANLDALNASVRTQKMLDQSANPVVWSTAQQALYNAGITEIPDVLHASEKAFIWIDTIKRFEIGTPPGDPLTSAIYPLEDPTSPPGVEAPIWDPTIQYYADEQVYHNGILYYARYINTNHEPGQTVTWQEVTDQWRYYNTYRGGDIVIYNGASFRAKWDTQGAEPTLTNTWQELTDEWRWYNSYVAGDIVIHNGLTYRAKWITQNSQPPSSVWQLLS